MLTKPCPSAGLAAALARPARLVLMCAWLAVPGRAGAAPTLKPWLPPNADSLVVWAAEARAGFQANTGDSIGGSNYHPYERVGFMGRRLLRALGRENLLQAHAIQPVLDSLGLSTELVIDPTLPRFALLMVHNPYRRTAGTVGYLYWYKVTDLRMQGMYFQGGWRPILRVWWSGKPQYPYECGVVDHWPTEKDALGFMLLRLSGDGNYWDLVQYPGAGPLPGGPGEAIWADLNNDGQPELVTWILAPSDSLFEECAGCRGLIDERIFTERREGFVLHDSRLLPSPYASFQLFVRLLLQNNRAAAARLLVNPAKLDQAIALGWGAHRGPGTWKLERVEEGEGWPQWLQLRLMAAKGKPLYLLRFTQRDGRWIIREWLREPEAAGAARAASDSMRFRGPGGEPR